MRTKPKKCTCHGVERPIWKNVTENGIRKRYCRQGYFAKYPPKKIPKESKRRKKENAEYRKITIPEGQVCQFPGCQSKAEDKHHTQGRGKNFLNKEKIKFLCRPHHTWITEHSKEAIEMGISQKRNGDRAA